MLFNDEAKHIKIDALQILNIRPTPVVVGLNHCLSTLVANYCQMRGKAKPHAFEVSIQPDLLIQGLVCHLDADNLLSTSEIYQGVQLPSVEAPELLRKSPL